MKTSKNVSNITLTNVRKVLKAAIFNPRKPGPMKIVSEVGSREYYELRAIEEIHAARVLRSEPEVTFVTPRCYQQHINKALQLLALAALTA